MVMYSESDESKSQKSQRSKLNEIIFLPTGGKKMIVDYKPYMIITK